MVDSFAESYFVDVVGRMGACGKSPGRFIGADFITVDKERVESLGSDTDIDRGFLRKFKFAVRYAADF